jgi:hypothetical protein
MFVEGTVAVIEPKVLFWVIAGARVTRKISRQQIMLRSGRFYGREARMITYQCLSP